jgi:host factor-I protein
MSQVFDAPAVVAPPVNVQDVFLNHARRERQPVVVHLMDGQQLDARITSFDKFAVVVEVDGVEQLIFKHAIAVIAASEPRSVRAGAPLPPRRP